jgi:alpha-amylase/alpha-mannosidase (GH57 family)
LSERFLCIHGHFYQPPRENPWLEAVEHQESAHPYHDWNERITAECYAPNAAARILDGLGRIVDIANNYESISFNFGPTLLAWLERKAPDVYAAILEADRISARRFGGHGSAIAQAYNHMILPLATRRDVETQVRWGIRDFERRFGRRPEGMWLPETAVSLEALDVMASEGILFTILAPHQADEIKGPGQNSWGAFHEHGDTGRAYRVALPLDRSIAVFFYDGAASRAVAFERLLQDGARFADQLASRFHGLAGDAPLVHIATDGETYGHHHRHGDMALAYALAALEQRPDVRLTNYGEYLALHPPTWEARIREHTSWSCGHGVGRWREDCGCASGRGAGWTQAWRQPLRQSLDWLRDQLTPHYEWEAGALLSDPWKARDAYVDVIEGRSEESEQAFFARHAVRPLEPAEIEQALRLLEMQRHTLLMYTSCGWFFDDISGIETTQVLLYAGRAIQLAGEAFADGQVLEEGFLRRLEAARSNLPEWGNGRQVYHRVVAPARVDRGKAGAHYAVSSVFDDYADDETIYSFRFVRRVQHRFEAGSATLLVGRVEVSSGITHARDDLGYAVLHLGHHNLVVGVRTWRGPDAFDDLLREVSTPFLRTDFANVIRVLDLEFEANTYSLRSLFSDAQRRIVDRILQTSIEEAESVFTRLYEDRAPLLRFLADLNVRAPRSFTVAAEYVLNVKLRRVLEHPDPQLHAIRAALDEALATGVPIHAESAGYVAGHTLEREMERLVEAPRDQRRLQRMIDLVGVLTASPLPLNLWTVQNRYFELLRQLAPAIRAQAEAGDQDAALWVDAFSRLGDTLRMAAPRAAPTPP